MDEMIRKTAQYVQGRLEDDASGHDWWHVWRVWNLARYIAEREGADMRVVELAALLHDIADWKFSDDDNRTPEARDWLESINVEPGVVSKVCSIIENVSYKGAGVRDNQTTLEGKVVQDADRLDALGAIGIGRAFAYGGYKRRKMHTPGLEPKIHQTFEEYKGAQGTTINHFSEKLLLLKDRMNTATARKMAQIRHRFMERYLDEFHKEWDGEHE
jgi:uncharacterized protein